MSVHKHGESRQELRPMPLSGRSLSERLCYSMMASVIWRMQNWSRLEAHGMDMSGGAESASQHTHKGNKRALTAHPPIQEVDAWSLSTVTLKHHHVVPSQGKEYFSMETDSPLWGDVPVWGASLPLCETMAGQNSQQSHNPLWLNNRAGVQSFEKS